MIAGATGIDVALLCIAADDGIMPQTIEHLHVLELLGVRTVVAALTKADKLKKSQLEACQAEFERLCAPYGCQGVFLTSAANGAGIDALRACLEQRLAGENTHGV